MANILAKLTEELRQPVTSERQVVYTLVELRKLMELEDGRKYPAYPALKFHCDWVAHPILKGTFAQNIVRLADAYQEWLDAGQNIVSTMFMAELGPTLTMTNFRNELNQYLRAQGLDPGIPNDDGNWASFLTYYARVIEDCPLRCVSQGLKHVDEVVLNVLDGSLAASEGLRLAIEWSWKSKLNGEPYRNRQLY
jgi:hypothetical protein